MMRNKDLSWRNFPGGTEINAEERGTSIRCLFGERRSSSPPGTLGSCQEPAVVQPGARPRGWEPAHPWGSIPEHPAQEAQRFPPLTCRSGGVPLTAPRRPSAPAVPVRPRGAAALCSPGGETASRGASALLLSSQRDGPPPKASRRTPLSSSPAWEGNTKCLAWVIGITRSLTWPPLWGRSQAARGCAVNVAFGTERGGCFEGLCPGRVP